MCGRRKQEKHLQWWINFYANTDTPRSLLNVFYKAFKYIGHQSLCFENSSFCFCPPKNSTCALFKQLQHGTHCSSLFTRPQFYHRLEPWQGAMTWHSIHPPNHDLHNEQISKMYYLVLYLAFFSGQMNTSRVLNLCMLVFCFFICKIKTKFIPFTEF